MRALRTVAISRIQTKSPAVGEEPFPFRGGMGHGAEMQVGDVAYVDTSEVEARAAGHGAVHQSLDEKDGG